MSSIDIERIEALIRWFRQLAAQKSEIEAQMASITAEIGDMVEVGWSIEVDGVPASKRKGRRSFSLLTAVTLLDAEEREEFKVERYDAEAVRALIEARGLLEQCMEDTGNAPSVVLR